MARTDRRDDESPSDVVWVETCEECESTGSNCPMHDGPEWDTDD